MFEWREIATFAEFELTLRSKELDQKAAEAKRIAIDGAGRTIIDGPFTETKELIAGFWIIQAASKEEAVDWARRVPLTEGQIEVRQVFEDSEFDQSNEYVQKEKVWRQEQESRSK